MTSRKEIQVSRMWQYFIDATVEIIENEGIEGVTAMIRPRLGPTTASLV